MDSQDQEISAERCAVIVMTRYPEAGQVKTRLIETLGEHGAANLHKRMAEHTMSTLQPLHDIETADLFVFFNGGSNEQMQRWLGSSFEYQPQQGSNLGEKMVNSFKHIFNTGYNRAVILGTDCPDIEGATVVQALKYLRSADLVLGPAEDGGYYLLGLNQTIPQLFEGIEWGSDRVLAQTTQQAKQQNLSIEYLHPLRDIDTPADLESIRGTFLLP
ncbi:MAG: TIGR04282 family arsenosugar biosynthesis glycosyltransferase [Desulfuromonadaceae bacterium]|jgi:rSAM/selenodomain-associated transferase 1|nr:TIGR04282 family arsenosugar biosynthesis glycosyltransferase [Desulfuromonadaceae bacterium]